jgi:hypothetical protein
LQQGFHNERQDKNTGEVEDMSKAEAYERSRIKDMVRAMIIEELRIDIYDTYGGVEVRLFLGDEIIQEKVFTGISQWDTD